MKRILLIAVVFICSCGNFDHRSNQQKAEELARYYLDSALNGQGDFKATKFGKVDSLLEATAKGKRQIGWSLYASYQGNDAYGAYEVHKVILKIDSGFSKVLAVSDYRP
ncbi:MAG: hypothetical protein JST50_08305 [Bacteroidetes bacterium]|jgi:hypothetical protein|nr:hypothetical protein [Bacteroidota bacterium]